jgi:hypothetical protein
MAPLTHFRALLFSAADVFYQEWMNYVGECLASSSEGSRLQFEALTAGFSTAYDSFCLRICTAENSTYSAAIECQHTFDLMGW